MEAQCIGVVRHAERADSMFAFLNGTRWHQTQEAQDWPTDPPLSDAGLVHARRMAADARIFAEGARTTIQVVVTSPYFRCVQTAVALCLELGQHTVLLVDRELGEVYGPSVMGEREPAAPSRPVSHLFEYCGRHGVHCKARAIGKWPTWPENLQGARRRYATRFLTLLQRAKTVRRNFLLITHADCVGAALRMMPSHADSHVESIDFGGMFFAKRQARPEVQERPGLEDASQRLVRFSEVVPTPEEAREDSPSFWAGAKKCCSLSAWEEDRAPQASRLEGSEAFSIRASEGWVVQTSDMTLQRRAGGAPGANFTKRVKRIARESAFTCEKVVSLLVGLPESSLQGEELQVPASTRQPTTLSFSTFLFGASDIGNVSDLGDSRHSTETCLLGSSLACVESTPQCAAELDVLQSPGARHVLPLRSWGPATSQDLVSAAIMKLGRGEERVLSATCARRPSLTPRARSARRVPALARPTSPRSPISPASFAPGASEGQEVRECLHSLASASPDKGEPQESGAPTKCSELAAVRQEVALKGLEGSILLRRRSRA